VSRFRTFKPTGGFVFNKANERFGPEGFPMRNGEGRVKSDPDIRAARERLEGHTMGVVIG